MLAYIIPIGGAGSPGAPALPGNALPGFPGLPGAPDQGLPGGPPPVPGHPIVLPPLPPGTVAPPNLPTHPIALPPAVPAHPIYIPDTPEHPIAQPPGTIWPPRAEIKVKTIALVWLPGYGFHWVVLSPTPPVAAPKT